ncbi:ActS/PrrB/RegB family redox-sensitive histidine kinase [uncultured Algimonas sp.]|uniref:ActS/PrrB/RegB family redox-sensitive histidine kinase n=1 Tax=uncultured Algimonas sp. TaxID=1547920 RepID=UPI00262A2D84|nr:ActS/PrrB/RegB family redox-sensitive histidine kinase [uncultured Algimonas sp.]
MTANAVTADEIGSAIGPADNGENDLDASHLPRRQLTGALRRYTLVLLRWGAVVGQAVTLFIVSQGLGFDVPVLPSLLVIGAAALVNIAVGLWLPLDRRVSDVEAIAQLGFDIAQLALLLYLNGGIENPFAILFLAPVVTSATTLSKRVLATVALMALAAATILLFWHAPLPWYPEADFKLPRIYETGILFGILVGTAFTSLYAWRATTESRKMSAALSLTEQRLAQEQKLSALGSLAAAAAHELGTPLATITVTAKEMTRELPDGPTSDDAALVLQQAQRCRSILEQLALRGDRPDLIHETLSLEDLLEEAAEGFIHRDKDLIVDSTQADGGVPLTIRRRPELLYALKNFTENAVDFADSRVELRASVENDRITVVVDDDGAGFDPLVRTRLGQPYVTTRAKGRSAGGLGLGVFIASTLVERTGGTVRFETAPIGGARVRCDWPVERLSA